MSRIYLIRHGRPASSWGGTNADPGLDEAGRAQALAVKETLQGLAPDERPTKVISSPLLRCRETAQPLAEAMVTSVEIDPAVGEVPTPAHLAVTDRPGWLRGAFAGRWSEISGDLDYDDWRRAVTAAVARRPGCAVFSHFVAINAVLSVIAGDDRVIAFRPDHTSITVLEVVEGRLVLVRRGAEAATDVL